MIGTFPCVFSVYFAIIKSKNLQNSSAIKNNSVTLSLVNIAIIVLYFFIIEHYEDMPIFANCKIYR